MVIGHFGLSFAGKKAAPRVSLAMLFIATQFVDLLWPILLVCHVERVAVVPGYTKTNSYEFLYFPYTHSLLMGVVWGAVLGAVDWLFKREKRGAIVVGLSAISSHWFLDLIVHTPDLPLTPFGDYKIGFGLWNQPVTALALEVIIFLAGVYVYVTNTRAKNKAGKWGLWTLVILLLAFQISNTFGPPPPDSIMTLFISFMALMAVIIGLAYWVDKNREFVLKEHV